MNRGTSLIDLSGVSGVAGAQPARAAPRHATPAAAPRRPTDIPTEHGGRRKCAAYLPGRPRTEPTDVRGPACADIHTTKKQRPRGDRTRNRTRELLPRRGETDEGRPRRRRRRLRRTRTPPAVPLRRRPGPREGAGRRQLAITAPTREHQ
ncbi:uncharacterized protein LOC133319100 isoform X2 [Danaus plexippus]|uniref:uncharacterized protein LOC133319100 isoform X2 n=1 Tax=Danaus plexippus TaxID=13037 RepID=UPI002AB2A429|nr:uncharacterized protein LOC133319100 isoform X2 [Danaus plexippus]